MDSDALATFLTVHREGGVSAAARRLNRTQSAISRRLALLEAQLGAPLFERIGRGLTLSQAGAALIPHAEKVAAALRDAAQAMEDLADRARGQVSLAAVGTLAGGGLTEVLRRFREAFPGVDIALSTATSAEVSDRVRRGEAAVGLRYFEDPSPDIRCQLVQNERLVVACSPRHPLAGRRIPLLKQLADQSWLAFPDHAERREAFAATIFGQFLARGVPQLNWTAVDSLTAQKRLVEAGFGLALLTESGAQEEFRAGTLATIEADDLEAAIPVVTVTRRDGFLTAAARGLIQALAEGLATKSPASTGAIPTNHRENLA